MFYINEATSNKNLRIISVNLNVRSTPFKATRENKKNVWSEIYKDNCTHL